MFIKGYTHTIDNKGRLTIPAKFRGGLAQGMVVTRGLDGCLVLYPLTEWERLTQKIDALPTARKDARNYRRLIYSEADLVEPDRQGRVLLPQNLREYAGLDSEATVIGLHTYIEIWNPQRWQEIRNKVEEEGESIAEKLAEAGI